ncbi:MAG: 6-hydroxymethylpterin diphosphokinase MptE-like protein [Phycisphaerales bacterium JB040]
MDLLNIDLPSDPTPGPGVPPSDGLLERNLKALALSSPGAARRILEAPPLDPATCELAPTDETTPEGAPALSLRHQGRTLASKRRPLSEGERLADTVSIAENAAVCVLGFGAGHHCRVLCERMGTHGVVICFEPDVSLLREVLSRIDCTPWLSVSRFVLCTEPDDRAAIARALEGIEGVIAMGVKILEHPPSRARLGEDSQRFADRFTDILRATKTQVTTTLLQSERTLRNLLMNIDRYASSAGVDDLEGVASDRPAVLVAAGPSLHAALDLLDDPGLRDRAVIIAVQTVLRPLLARGIRPHFVTTLDYHEISTRFYEGLTEADVEGVTLVADPKVNPAVLGAWPGAVRLSGSDLLDDVLAAPRRAALKPGATVAHLSYYLARHLGCDPAILVGQDLAFSDCLYYGPDAAIHRTWGPELGEFRTLETLEWERIARHKKMLRQTTDRRGRPIFTDDQLASYLAQFETDFAADAALGRAVIDATGGGVPKANTTALSLERALSEHACEPRPGLPAPVPPRENAPRTCSRVGEVRRQAERIGERSRETASILRSTLEHQRDTRRTNEDIARVNAIRDEVLNIHPGWRLTEFVNQRGTLNRVRADRAIAMADPRDPLDRQRRQIERDIGNVETIADAADRLGVLLEQTAGMLEGSAARLTRDPAPAPEPAGLEVAARPVIDALIPVDHDRSTLGTPRNLDAPIAGGHNALELTVARLLLAERVDRVRLLSPDPDRTRALLGPLASRPSVHVHRVDGDRLRSRARLIANARAFAPACWRGGPGSLTCYDECLDPGLFAEVMREHGTTAALVLGPDWALVDPELTDAIVERHLADPEHTPVLFTQAPPGLAPALMARTTVANLGAAQARLGLRATLGGLLAYIPTNPIADPIATPACVGVAPEIRDIPHRLTAGSPDDARRLGELIGALGRNWIECTGADIAAELAADERPAHAPQHLRLEPCTGRLTHTRNHDHPQRRPLAIADANRILRQLAASRPDAALTLHGDGDPLAHPRAVDLLHLASECGVQAVHLRTELVHDVDPDALLEARPAVISVDCHARSPELYRDLTGIDRLALVHERLSALLEASMSAGAFGLPATIVVPRLAKRDASLHELPDFYDGALVAGACAVIDPAPREQHERLRPLPLPPSARRRRELSHMSVASDGRVLGTRATLSETLSVGAAWRHLLSARRSSPAILEAKSARARAGAA